MKRHIAHLIGRRKEQDARRWLEKQGIQIIAENFTCRGGEIDLIGLDETTLVAFEVRYRQSASHGSAAESITPGKLQRLMRCFQAFVQKHPQYAQSALRIDVIAWEGEAQTPEWLRNVTL